MLLLTFLHSNVLYNKILFVIGGHKKPWGPKQNRSFLAHIVDATLFISKSLEGNDSEFLKDCASQNKHNQQKLLNFLIVWNNLLSIDFCDVFRLCPPPA